MTFVRPKSFWASRAESVIRLSSYVPSRSANTSGVSPETPCRSKTLKKPGVTCIIRASARVVVSRQKPVHGHGVGIRQRIGRNSHRLHAGDTARCAPPCARSCATVRRSPPHTRYNRDSLSNAPRALPRRHAPCRNPTGRWLNTPPASGNVSAMNQITIKTTNNSATTQRLLRHWFQINVIICRIIFFLILFYCLNASTMFTRTARHAGTIDESRFKTKQAMNATRNTCPLRSIPAESSTEPSSKDV